MNPNIKVTLSLPASLIKTLRKDAERDRRTISAVTALALEAYFKSKDEWHPISK